MVLKYWIISFIVAYCWDVSGGWREMTKAICGWLTKGKIHNPIEIKPFGCSVCMTFWLCLLYTLVTWRITLVNIALCCLASWAVDINAAVMLSVKELFLSVINKLLYINKN